MEQDPLLFLTDVLSKEDSAIAVTMLFILKELKRQKGFDVRTFNRRMLSLAKAAAARGDNKIAFYLTLAGGRTPRVAEASN